MIAPDMTLFICILVAGFYMAWNIGANDVANAMGTSVGSGALTLKRAIVIAAVFEFSGAFFFGAHVSKTVQSGILNISLFDADPLIYVYGMLASLLACGVWLQIASYFGWPVSTTHSIIGAIVGFGAIVAGVDAVEWGKVSSIVLSWVISPVLGAVIAYALFSVIRSNIFFVTNPIRSMKRWTPVFTFLVIAILSASFLLSCFDSFECPFDSFDAGVATLVIAMIAAIISRYLVKDIPEDSIEVESSQHPEMIIGLGKVRKHLRRLRGVATDEISERLGAVIKEVDSIGETMEKEPKKELVKDKFYQVERVFAYLQILTACLMAFAHGANDVANAIGPLTGSIDVLMSGKMISSNFVPTWALALGGVGIVVGLATWGWRVILTIGKKITELTPSRGFACEFGAALTVLVASRLGLPISATHTLIGAILGVGMARGLEAINLSITRDILASWVVTLPAGATFSVIFFYIIQAIFS